MNRVFVALLIMVVMFIAGCGAGQHSKAAQTKGPMLAHNVYFTLKDSSDSAKSALTDSCYKYLKDHPGVVFFAAGPIAEELDRPVNVRDFDIGLHVIFKNMKFHDQYQTADRHLKFIEENEDNFEQVRVFDTLVR